MVLPIASAVLDGIQMTSRAAAHDHLAAQLGFPAYYGRNLDALWDLLTTHHEEKLLIVRNCAILRETLGPYGEALLKTLTDAAATNSHLHLVMVL